MHPRFARFHSAIAACAALLSSGCAMTHEEFKARRQSMTDLELCLAAEDARIRKNGDFVVGVYREKSDRQLSDDRCELLIAQRRQQIDATANAIIEASAAVADVSRGGRKAPPPSPIAFAPTDYTWQWDQFFGPDGVLVWACRGEQTGQFADYARCAGKMKSDWRWPGWTLTR